MGPTPRSPASYARRSRAGGTTTRRWSRSSTARRGRPRRGGTRATRRRGARGGPGARGPPPPAPPPLGRRHFPRRWHRSRRALYGLLGVIALGVVSYVSLRKAEPPQLDLVMPSHARVGDVVILSGSAFAHRPEDNSVLVGDYAARVLEATRNRLLIEVPDMSLDPGERKTAPV